MNVTNANFLLYAASNYISPHYYEEEFFSDLKKFKYIKRLFCKYNNGEDLKCNLILNHIVTLYNVFYYQACTNMLFLKIPEDNYKELKTFLVYLNYMPDSVSGVNNKTIISSDIGMNYMIIDHLRTL